jgi:hypothetical protein
VRLGAGLAGGEARDLLRGIPADWPILTWGPIVACKAAGAQAFGELLVAHRPPPSQWSERMSPKEVVGPAVFVNQRGKGRVVYCPCSVDVAFAGEYRVPEHRNLIANLVRWLHPAPLVAVEAPRNVEIVLTRDEAHKRLLVHFLCFSAPATFAAVNFADGRRVLPPQMEEPMAYVAQVRVGQPVAKARAADPATKVVLEGNSIRMETSRIHEVLIVESVG